MGINLQNNTQFCHFLFSFCEDRMDSLNNLQNMYLIKNGAVYKSDFSFLGKKKK